MQTSSETKGGTHHPSTANPQLSLKGKGAYSSATMSTIGVPSLLEFNKAATLWSSAFWSPRSRKGRAVRVGARCLFALGVALVFVLAVELRGLLALVLAPPSGRAATSSSSSPEDFPPLPLPTNKVPHASYQHRPLSQSQAGTHPCETTTRPCCAHLSLLLGNPARRYANGVESRSVPEAEAEGLPEPSELLLALDATPTL